MRFLSTKEILDTAVTFFPDGSIPRPTLLAWLNLAMQSVVNEPRDWEFLKKKPNIAIDPITGNVTLPADFADLISISFGDTIFTMADVLSSEQAFNATLTGGNPVGITIDETTYTLTVIPSADYTAVVEYKAAMPTAGYVDDVAATIFPVEFLNLFVRYLRTMRNEFDVEDAFAISVQLDGVELKKCKTLDNNRKGLPKFSSHGYIKTKG